MSPNIDWVSPYHDCERLVSPEFEISLVTGDFFASLLRRDTGALGESGAINIPMVRRAGDNPDCMAFVLHSKNQALAGVYVQNARREGVNEVSIQAICAANQGVSKELVQLFVKECIEYLSKSLHSLSIAWKLEGKSFLDANLLNELREYSASLAKLEIDKYEILQKYLNQPIKIRFFEKLPGYRSLNKDDLIVSVNKNLLGLPPTRPVELSKNIHNGGRVFILASGPSLNDCNLEKLSSEKVIVVNRSLLAYPRADYTVSMAEHAFANFGSLLAKSRVLFTTHDRPFGIKMPTLGIHGFSFDLSQGIYTGDTVSLVALQVAVYLGFRSIHFLGLDLKNTQSNTHFFGKDPLNINHEQTEFPRMKKAFELALPELKKRGIRVTNSSVLCELDCFERVPFHLLIP